MENISRQGSIASRSFGYFLIQNSFFKKYSIIKNTISIINTRRKNIAVIAALFWLGSFCLPAFAAADTTKTDKAPTQKKASQSQKPQKNQKPQKKNTDPGQQSKSSPKDAKTGSKDLTYGYQAPKEEDMPSATWLLVKTIGILALFVLGFLLLFRIISKKNKSQVLGSSLVQVLANVPIANQRFLQVVDIAGNIYILGVTEHNINLITQIQDSKVLSQVKLEASRILQEKESLSFQELIQRSMGLTNSGKSSSDTASAAPTKEMKMPQHGLVKEFMSRHKKRLEELQRKGGSHG